MSAPTPYARLKNFTDYAIAHPEATFNASDLDAELNALLLTVSGLVSNRVLIQRDDGALANDSVHPDSLSTATLLLIEAAGQATGLADLVRGYWTTATAYSPGEIVQYVSRSYICAVAHTSGNFDNDYVAGDKWIILGETSAAGASALSFSPAGDIAALTVQTAIEELDADKAKLAGQTGQVFSVGDATAAAHAPSMGQIQRNTLKSATATGTADAIAATIASGLTTLTDGMEFIIEAPGTNTLTSPTLNITLGTTATGAKTIIKGNDIPLIAGDIASNKCHFVYDISLDKWVLINPVFAVGATSSDASPGDPKNIGLSFSVGGDALLATVTTAAGSVPTPGDQIRVPMRSSNTAIGTFNVRTIRSSMGLTISSGSTLGHTSGAVSDIHWYLIDNAGTLELAASTKYFGIEGIVSTTAEGGAGAADSATVMYSATARTNVPYLWIGRTSDTQTTAGTWLSAPSETRLTTNQIVDEGVTTAKLAPVVLSADAAGRNKMAAGFISQDKLASGVAGTGPAFVVFSSGAQALTSGVAVKVNFGAENTDTHDNFASSRFTPTVAGLYQVSWSVNVNDAGGASIGVVLGSLYRNGVEWARGGQLNIPGAAGVTVMAVTGSTLVPMNGTTDYLEVYIHGASTAPQANSASFSGFLARAA